MFDSGDGGVGDGNGRRRGGGEAITAKMHSTAAAATSCGNSGRQRFKELQPEYVWLSGVMMTVATMDMEATTTRGDDNHGR